MGYKRRQGLEFVFFFLLQIKRRTTMRLNKHVLLLKVEKKSKRRTQQ
jgi:hypothetical protein